MKRTDVDVMVYYDNSLIQFLNEKYDLNYIDAFKKLINSKTYDMLLNPEYAMWDFGPKAILDMWENEKITGTPQTSSYLRSENDA